MDKKTIVLIAIIAIAFITYMAAREFPEVGAMLMNAWTLTSSTIVSYVTMTWWTGMITGGLIISLIAIILWKGYWRVSRWGYKKTVEPIYQTQPAYQPQPVTLVQQPVPGAPVQPAPTTQIEKKEQ